MNQHLLHDAALMMADHLVALLNLREEQQRDAVEEFYRVCLAGLESYEIQADRMVRRLKPMEN